MSDSDSKYKIITKDSIANIGIKTKEEDFKSMGAFGIMQRNEREGRLIEFAEEHKVIIANTLLQKPHPTPKQKREDIYIYIYTHTHTHTHTHTYIYIYIYIYIRACVCVCVCVWVGVGVCVLCTYTLSVYSGFGSP